MSLLNTIFSYFNSCKLQIKTDREYDQKQEKKEKIDRVISETGEVTNSNKERLDKLIATIDSDPDWFLAMCKKDKQHSRERYDAF